MWWGDYWHGPWMFFGPLVMGLFFLACITVLLMLILGAGAGRRRDAMDILKERYARGEIDQAEFEERSRLLSTPSLT
jgi:putative membrane protein